MDPGEGYLDKEGATTMDSRKKRVRSLAAMLLDWQSTADERHLESLLRVSSPLMWRTARSVLVRHGVADPAAVDDAVSLVLDHVRRLAGVSPNEKKVSRFEPSRTTPATDPGEAYLVWLSTERARDIARTRRARARFIQPLSHVETGNSLTPLQALVGSSVNDTDDLIRLHRAIEGLKDRQAVVIQMLIIGQSQATIAAELKVCEGTVSRLRTRAITRLRQLLTTS
jgi:RNA polymerase sigma factor (sigma-70 family)